MGIVYKSQAEAAEKIKLALEKDNWQDYFYALNKKALKPYLIESELDELQGEMGMDDITVARFYNETTALTVMLDVLKENIERMARFAMRDTYKSLYLLKTYAYPVGLIKEPDCDAQDVRGVSITLRKAPAEDFDEIYPLGIYVSAAVVLPDDSPFMKPYSRQDDDEA